MPKTANYNKRVCKHEGCNNVIKTKYNEKGWAANNKQVYCDYHFLGGSNKNPLSIQFKTIKNRAKANGVECTISIADLREAMPDDMICPVFGFKMEHGDDSIHGRNNSPSVDRIDPKKGYTPDNIQIISKLANSMKQNATPEQLRMFAKWVESEFKA